MCIEHYLAVFTTTSHDYYYYPLLSYCAVEHFWLNTTIHDGKDTIQLLNEEHPYPTKKLVLKKAYRENRKPNQANAMESLLLRKK